MKKIKLELKDRAIRPIKKARRLVISPKKISSIFFIIFLIAIVWYFSREITFLTAAPDLEINSPFTDLIVSEESFEVIGKTDPTAFLTINDNKIFIEKDGNFNNLINLVAGVNLIKIKAENRFGKTNEIIRRIIYERQENKQE